MEAMLNAEQMLAVNAKSFRAPTIAAALARVQRELGPDAMVLATRKVLAAAPWQVWREPEFEVLATGGPNGPTKVTAATSAPAFMPMFAPTTTQTAAPVVASHVESNGWTEQVSNFYHLLIEQCSDEGLARSIATSATEMLGPRALIDDRMVKEYFRRELEAKVKTGEYLPRKGEQRIVVMVGVTGAGKTSAAAKLAAYAHYTLGRSAALISADTYGVGALAQAQTYADILQMPLNVVYTPADLSAAIAQQKDTDVVIIDTPGRNPHRTAEILELTTLLAPLPATRRVMLVASATAKLRDLLETAAAFKGIGTHGLIFTKLDETDSFGTLHSLAAITGLPTAYYCSGPRVPQDIEPATTDKLVRLMFGESE